MAEPHKTQSENASQPQATPHFVVPGPARSHDGAEAVAAAEPHGAEVESVHEVPNAFILLRNSVYKDNEAVKHTLELVENTFFSLIVVVVIGVIIRLATRRMSMIPGKLQNIVEFAIESFDKFICGIMGQKYGRQHLPFVGSLFFFILFNNLIGLVPLCKSPTSAYQTTLALGLCTFLYVQWHAIRMNGLWGYAYHLMGSPKGAIMWVFAPFLFLLELMGEFIKPVSLSLRLFGNIMGEDILLYVFSFLGMSLLVWGFPLHFPFFFLALLTSTIQALVFSLLATIYITLFIPHEHEGHGEHEEA
jgi:F-type H+-transporting ATPase subunit a